MSAASSARPTGPLARLLAVLALVVLASCPTPIDRARRRLVEDDIPPELAIATPVGNTLYGATVQVSGTLRDAAFAVGDGQGRLESLAFSVPGFPTLSQLVHFDPSGGCTVTGEDLGFAHEAGTGDFSFAFSTVGLSGGPKVLVFVAADFNGNTSERALTLLEDPSGPHVVLDIPTNLSYYGITVNLQGSTTNSPSDPATNDVRLIQWECAGEVGSWSASGGSSGNLSYDTGTGQFTGWFSTIGMPAGTLGVRLYAEDFGGHRTEVGVQLLDNRPGPEIIIQGWPAVYSSAVTTSVTVSGKVWSAGTDWRQVTYLAYGAPSGSTGAVITNHSPEIIYIPLPTYTGYDLFSFTFNPKSSAPPISGLMTVKVQARDSGGRESEESVTGADDPVRPTFSLPCSLAANNSYLDIPFSEAVYTNSNGTGALLPGDFSLAFAPNGGAATGASISAVSMPGADTARLTLSITGTPSGLETITVTPATTTAIYDLVGNPIASGQTTGAVTLHDRLAPTISSASMDSDNEYLEVVFSEGVYASGGGDLVAADFSLTFRPNGGTATNAALSSLTRVSDSRYRLNLAITGTPDGNETVEAEPASASSIYDAADNPMSAAESTGEVHLNP